MFQYLRCKVFKRFEERLLVIMFVVVVDMVKQCFQGI